MIFASRNTLSVSVKYQFIVKLNNTSNAPNVTMVTSTQLGTFRMMADDETSRAGVETVDSG